jgi:nitrogen fixation protein
MQSFSAHIALIVSGFAAALALIIGQSVVESTPGPAILLDNGWSTPGPATLLDNGWSAPAPAVPQDDNGWS